MELKLSDRLIAKIRYSKLSKFFIIHLSFHGDTYKGKSWSERNAMFIMNKKEATKFCDFLGQRVADES